jgi:hypothetical protein
VPGIQHLHTYFLFPFAIDKQQVCRHHAKLWPGAGSEHWMQGLDRWVETHRDPARSRVVSELGAWKRCAYSRFDMDSAAYHNMVFFHPFVRGVFFDVTAARAEGREEEPLLHAYIIGNGQLSRVYLEASDIKGRSAKVNVTDLRLYLFANGIGVLSIGVEARDVTSVDALWINEAMRKVYPSSGRQVREGRAPNRMALLNGNATIAEENFADCRIRGVLPPLASTITSLLYFADYDRFEYEPVLDERMIVYTYAQLDPETLGPGYISSEDYQVFLSRLLYVDRHGNDYRYDPGFVKQQMSRQMYRRWAHQGTYYGFTSYSNVTCAIGAHDCDEHDLREGFLIHRMFESRYFLMALVALFYRATLLSFAERTAIVSKLLYLDQEDGRIEGENIRAASALRAEFLHFSNYWHFDELANKDEETEHFEMQAREYHIEPMKREIEGEIDKLNASLDNYYTFRNTEAVNRVAMLSLIFGAGAVITGFFGMNFAAGFGRLFFEPTQNTMPVHVFAIAIVSLFSLAALAFGLYVVMLNWPDYREIFVVRWPFRRAPRVKEP